MANLIYLAFIIIGQSFVECADTCVQKSSCSCQNSKGLLDLTPIAFTNSTARWVNLKPSIASDSYLYSWNPCNNFNLGSPGKSTEYSCQNVAACQNNPDASDPSVKYANLGNQASAKFITLSDDSIIIQYAFSLLSSPQITQRIAHVELVCSDDYPGTTTAAGEKTFGTGVYVMTYKGLCACPGKKCGPGSEHHGLSPGSILLIVFFVLLIVYFAAGVAFQHFYRHASGKEVIPNIDFWMGLGPAIKAGFMFTICRKKDTTYGNF